MERLINLRSTLVRSGHPAVYQLKTKKEELGGLTKVKIGENDIKTNKTILLIGETGAGKSTLINTLVNYVMGVKFEDDVWFQIVEEEEGGTSDVIVYEIFGFEDSPLPYALTIIDSPGYGNTEGIKHDRRVSNKLLDLFQSKDGVDQIHSVALVMKATDNRLSDRLMYVFNSVTSLFAKDLERNIIALITHSDGRKPKNALKALEEAKIKCDENRKNPPVYFLFNNCQHEDRTDEIESLIRANKLCEKEISQFITYLEKMEPKKLKETIKVLNARISLLSFIQNLEENITQAEMKQTEFKQIQDVLNNYKDIKDTEYLTEEDVEVYKDKEPIDGGMCCGIFYSAAVCCTVCEENCHYPCTIAWSPKYCEVMRGGRCTVCTQKCPASVHLKEKWIYVSITRKVQQQVKNTNSNIRTKSEDQNLQSDLENLKKEIDQLTQTKLELLENSYQAIIILEQNAMNVDSMFTYVHLDYLIEKMNENGDVQKVKTLEEIKSRVDEGTKAALRYKNFCEKQLKMFQ